MTTTGHKDAPRLTLNRPLKGESLKLHRNLGPKASSIGSVFQR